MEKRCLECKEILIGRSDKKFCDDACRNAYNNRQNRHINNTVRSVNRILSKNYRILVSFNPNGKSTTTREALLSRGFNFDYHTSIYETRRGQRYFFCYDQGYIYLDDHKIALVKKYKDMHSQGMGLGV